MASPTVESTTPTDETPSPPQTSQSTPNEAPVTADPLPAQVNPPSETPKGTQRPSINLARVIATPEKNSSANGHWECCGGDWPDEYEDCLVWNVLARGSCKHCGHIRWGLDCREGGCRTVNEATGYTIASTELVQGNELQRS